MDETVKFYDYLKNLRCLADLTIYHYFYHYRKFIGTELTQDNITAYILNHKNNSVSRGFMKNYLEFLKRHREFELPPLPRGTKKKKLIRTIPEKDVKRIIEVAYAKKFKKGMVIELIYYGALRRNEFINIKINDFEWEEWLYNDENHCKLQVYGKGKKERMVLIPPNVMGRLFEHLLERNFIKPTMSLQSIITVLNQSELRIINMGARRVLATVNELSYEAIGIKLRTHELRHAFATHLEEKGANIRDIQRYLGHSSTAVTEIYLHTDEKKSIINIQEIIKEKKE